MNIFGMGIMWLILILLILALIYYSDKDLENDLSSQEMLENRYLKGEINAQEYQVIKESLRL
ncbi:MAG: putative membrane protein [Sulfurimonas sp.]|jgi:uncharacterized membrane protein